MHKGRFTLRGIDWLVVVPALFILSMGLLVQYAILFKTKGIAIDANLHTQIIAALLGLATVVGLFFVPTNTWRKKSFIFYALCMVLLVLVAFFGSNSNGAERWIVIAGFQMQPTEIAKLGTILFLAHTLDVRSLRVNKLLRIVRSLLIVGVPAGLVLLQPSLGSAIVFVVMWLTMLFASRIQLGRFIGLLIILGGLVLVSVPFLAEYQQERLVSYFNPQKDTSGANYNVVQAGIAIGSGGLTGNGLDSGSQSQLNFLPAQHTDFIFAVTAEKLGLVGAGSIIFAFMVLYTRILYIAWRVNGQFERLILVGIVSVLFFHSFVNIGMNLGIVPVTGLPLPLLSYGGTFLYATIVALGMVVLLQYRQFTFEEKHGYTH